jgi:gamma-glutamylcyclotransferase (GGCT)/AIG2-like uncharacterized protein YtfP
MIIYNVTINIDEKVQQAWLDWMQSTHIPEMLATGKFIEAKMSRVLVDEEMGGITYSVQYTALNREMLQRYYDEDAPRLRQDTQERFGGKFVAFRTELDVLNIQQNTVESATEYLFVYGTLLERDVRKLVFTRELDGRKDLLSGYRIHRNKVSGLYPSVEATGQDKDQVNGEVFVVNTQDLKRADQYEGDAYARKRVILASGTEAWVYQEKSV